MLRPHPSGIHVDLDGAREGKLVKLEVVRAITKAVGIPCELGGGVRSESDIRTLLDAGAAYPLMKELLGFADVDTKALESKARALLGETLAEVDEDGTPKDGPAAVAPEPSPKRAA